MPNLHELTDMQAAPHTAKSVRRHTTSTAAYEAWLPIRARRMHYLDRFLGQFAATRDGTCLATRSSVPRAPHSITRDLSVALRITDFKGTSSKSTSGPLLSHEGASVIVMQGRKARQLSG
jgi:hypothetical protein